MKLIVRDVSSHILGSQSDSDLISGANDLMDPNYHSSQLGFRFVGATAGMSPFKLYASRFDILLDARDVHTIGIVDDQRVCHANLLLRAVMVVHFLDSDDTHGIVRDRRRRLLRDQAVRLVFIDSKGGEEEG
jgi:hypothetical protein